MPFAYITFYLTRFCILIQPVFVMNSIQHEQSIEETHTNMFLNELMIFKA